MVIWCRKHASAYAKINFISVWTAEGLVSAFHSGLHSQTLPDWPVTARWLLHGRATVCVASEFQGMAGTQGTVVATVRASGWTQTARGAMAPMNIHFQKEQGTLSFGWLSHGFILQNGIIRMRRDRALLRKLRLGLRMHPKGQQSVWYFAVCSPSGWEGALSGGKTFLYRWIDRCLPNRRHMGPAEPCAGGTEVGCVRPLDP
jgi:hypothetical protein